MTKNGQEIQNHLEALEKEFIPKSNLILINPEFGI